MSVVKWRVFCIAENAWSEGFLESGVEPSSCFNNTGHTINTSSYQQQETISNTKVEVLEEHIPTGGNYKAVSYKCINNSGINIHNYIYNYPITALRISFNSHESNRDDTLEVLVAPNTTIGVVTTAVSISDTIITVSPTVLLYIKVGYHVNITDGTNNDSLGCVHDINILNSTIIVNTPTVHAFAINSYIQMTIKPIEDYTFGYAGPVSLGDCKIGGESIPMDTVIRVIYTNNKETSTLFYPVIEYLY
jgi:hypothetical protein